MLTRRTLLAGLAAAPMIPAIARTARAASHAVFNIDGVAINGHDPVAYFTEGAPVEGLAEFTADWDGATLRFASATNRDMFLADRDRFTPKFGGYCAYAASLGYLAPTVPEAWTVFEDRLYLNASLRARELWLRDVPGNIAKGMANWPGILES
ncbi:YHS domain-containing (seleno)protein [Aliiroseovarius sp.]|uniref:YHS domain-containing (seleno)protein n=1 Tax=Aliiroseovarius sp. TaxID=1872442 RepID=UPI00262FB139|nr:YHS domain-containing (seleno)protein [Aliiroseovarius sp.]